MPEQDRTGPVLDDLAGKDASPARGLRALTITLSEIIRPQGSSNFLNDTWRFVGLDIFRGRFLLSAVPVKVPVNGLGMSN